MKQSSNLSALRPDEENDRRRDDQIQDRHRQQKFPPEVHQLIKAKARQRAAQPDVKKEKEDDLAEKIEDAENRKRRHAGAIPTAEEDRRRQHRDREHVDVLGHKEEGKLQGAVFRVEARDEFRLSFGKIKRHAVRLGNGRDQIDDEAERLEENVPLKSMPAALL